MNIPKELLSADGVFQMSTFLTYLPRFKNDIILIMDTNLPTDIPPPVLPSSITTLLAML
jgi:hypothetical protein